MAELPDSPSSVRSDSDSAPLDNSPLNVRSEHSNDAAYQHCSVIVKPAKKFVSKFSIESILGLNEADDIEPSHSGYRPQDAEEAKRVQFSRALINATCNFASCCRETEGCYFENCYKLGKFLSETKFESKYAKKFDEDLESAAFEKRLNTAISFRELLRQKSWFKSSRGEIYRSARPAGEMILKKGRKMRSRIRTNYSAKQILMLERAFKRYQYLSKFECITLAREAGITETNVRIWFQNRRMKQKKAMLGKLKK